MAEGDLAAALTSQLKARVDNYDEIDDAVLEYLTASATELLNSFSDEVAKSSKSTQNKVTDAVNILRDEVSPLLEEVGVESSNDIDDICTVLVKTYLGIQNDNSGENGSNGGCDEHVVRQVDYALELHGVILAFAGRVLLKPSDIKLETGGRYGLVGPNGAGKTTLLNKLAAGDFIGFPEELRIVYIQHEVHDGGSETCLDYLMRMSGVEGFDKQVAPLERVEAVLTELGFTQRMQRGSVAELSGGWRMRLAIGRSMLAKATLLLLDEPTNHLDRNAVAWLVDHLKSKTDTTILFVSHDASFLDAVATDIINLNNTRLDFYKCSFYEFCRKVPEFRLHTTLTSEIGIANGCDDSKGSNRPEEEMHDVSNAESNGKGNGSTPQFMIGGKPLSMTFPDPGVLDGIKSRNKVIMKAVDVHFGYDGSQSAILKGATVRVMLSSRVALMGANGAGKTTLIKLLIGELALQRDGKNSESCVPDASKNFENSGEIYRHHNLRISYIAQHSMHHLGENLDMTPLEYVQNRFYFGEDKEVNMKVTIQLTEEEMRLKTLRGNIEEVVGRRMHGNQVEYECVKNGRRTGDTVWEPLVNLKHMNPYVMKLCRNYDEKMKLMAARTGLRSLTYEDIQRHLDLYGIRSDLSRSKIKRMSGGQKSRLVIAAAMWTKPHVLVLDEPTNFLDNETMLALVEALRTYKGGVLLISHNHEFVQNVAKNKWIVEDGKVQELDTI